MRAPVLAAAAAVLAVAVSAGAARAEEPKAASKVAFEALAPDVETLDAVLAKAKVEKKPVFLDFWSPT
jgi:uncharacterized tellurite resistance protein B-like protein